MNSSVDFVKEHKKYLTPAFNPLYLKHDKDFESTGSRSRRINDAAPVLLISNGEPRT